MRDKIPVTRKHVPSLQFVRSRQVVCVSIHREASCNLRDRFQASLHHAKAESGKHSYTCFELRLSYKTEKKEPKSKQRIR